MELTLIEIKMMIIYVQIIGLMNPITEKVPDNE